MKDRTPSGHASPAINLAAVVITSALTGFIVGVASAAFLRLLDWTIRLIWEDLPARIAPGMDFLPYPLLICTLGGIIVGLCQKTLGDHPPSLQETLQAFRKTGRIEYKHLPNGIVNVFASLIFGGSLGPEAALTDLIGGLATWFGDVSGRHHYIRRALTYAAVSGGLAFFGSPIGGAFLAGESSEEEPVPAFPKFLPGLIGALAGFGGFAWFMGMSLNGFHNLDTPGSSRPVDLLLVIPIALVGAAAGIGYQAAVRVLGAAFAPLSARPVLRGFLGGLGLGLIGTCLPLALFSGENDFRNLAADGARLGFSMILLSGAAKLLANALCISTGWKGGTIFPVIYGGSAIGLGCSLLFPSVPPILGIAGGMAAASAAVLRQPLAVMILGFGLLRGEATAAIILATLIGHTVTMPFSPRTPAGGIPGKAPQGQTDGDAANTQPG